MRGEITVGLCELYGPADCSQRGHDSENQVRSRWSITSLHCQQICEEKITVFITKQTLHLRNAMRYIELHSRSLIAVTFVQETCCASEKNTLFSRRSIRRDPFLVFATELR